MLAGVKNLILHRHRYHTVDDAVIIACFYNPQHSPYRLLAFAKWYASIKHLNHRIVECLIGEDHESQLPASPWITHVHTDELLWHKETLLNQLVADLPARYRYVFWMDTDVLLTNQRWLVEGVTTLQTATICQPWRYCLHLERHETAPGFDVDALGAAFHTPTRHPRMWASFAFNCARHPDRAASADYDLHGHVGFLWGARREVLDQVSLYDQALIGGADHIIAHAAAGHIPHPCITQAFASERDQIFLWSAQFNAVTKNQVGYAPGDLYHLWHGDIAQRQYLSRIQDFAKDSTPRQRNAQGFWVKPGSHGRMSRYYQDREAWESGDYEGYDTGFADIMGYALADIPRLFGGNPYEDAQPVDEETIEEAITTPGVEPTVFVMPEGQSTFS